MPWHDDGEPDPQRPRPADVPEQELFTLIRGRRLQVFIGVVAVVVVAAGALAVARIGGDPDTDVAAGSRQTTTGQLSDTASVTSAPPSSAPPTSAPAVPPESNLPRTGGSPGANPGPADSTPPTSAPVAADTCSPNEVLVTAIPDRPVYPRGQDVVVTATARNQSSRRCDPRDPSVEIRDRAGALVFKNGLADRFTFPFPVDWPSGGELTESFQWNRTVCNDAGCQRAAPGTYTLTAAFGDYRSPPVSFEIL